MGKRLLRNAVITDPATGQRRVLKGGTTVDDDLVRLVDPKAFGEAAPAPEPIPAQAPADFVGVPLEALLAYAEGRDIEVPEDADAHEVLVALIDADEALAEHVQQLQAQLDAAGSSMTGAEQPTGDGPAPEPPAALSDEEVAALLGQKYDEVNTYLDEHPEHREQLLAAEAAAEKPRKGITEGPHAAEPPSTQQE